MGEPACNSREIQNLAPQILIRSYSNFDFSSYGGNKSTGHAMARYSFYFVSHQHSASVRDLGEYRIGLVIVSSCSCKCRNLIWTVQTPVSELCNWLRLEMPV